MKKNFSLKIFNLIAKRVYKISKKRKLGWTWQQCQKWTSANLFKSYKGKSFVSLIVEQNDFFETIKLKFEVFDSKLVDEFINKKFKLYDFIGLCFKENTAINSQTNEQFIKRRVNDTFVVHQRLNLSNLAWKKYAHQSRKSDKAN